MFNTGGNTLQSSLGCVKCTMVGKVIYKDLFVHNVLIVKHIYSTVTKPSTAKSINHRLLGIDMSCIILLWGKKRYKFKSKEDGYLIDHVSPSVPKLTFIDPRFTLFLRNIVKTFCIEA